jgi:signal transduction histidine kinase
MRRLVADLLLLARSDAGRERRVEPVDVGQVAIDAVGEAGSLSAEHRLEVAVDPDLVVDGTRDDLHRLVLNLVENAVNHTPAGTRISVRARGAGERVELLVEDDGPGVPPDLRERIFERFVRAGGDCGPSTGLGLAIVRAVAIEHGGEVVLEDARPGARFVVTLPRREPPAQRPADAQEPLAAASPAGTTRRAALARRVASRRPSRRR